MIYMIEIDYTDPASEPEWNAWYEGYIRDLTTVPGIRTAQRFRGVGKPASQYLAIYSIADPSAYVSERYRTVGGGGTASQRWKPHIHRRRCLYEGVDWLPEVGEGFAFAATETEPEAADIPSVLFSPLNIVDLSARGLGHDFGVLPFDLSPARRFVAIADPARLAPAAAPNVISIYRPSGPRSIGGRDG